MSEIHFRSRFWPFQIDRPFWISEIHFWSQFWPFQIDTEFCFFSAAILDVWKSLRIAFLAISDWSAIFYVRNSLSMVFLAISDPYGTFYFDKMAAGGHFRCPQITFDRISGHFRSIHNFFFKFFSWQNGHRRPFWMGRQCQLSNSSEMSNACVKFEERSLNPSKVIALIKSLTRRRRWQRRQRRQRRRLRCWRKHNIPENLRFSGI